VSLNHTLPVSLYYSTHRVLKSHVKLRTSNGYLLPRTDSSLNRSNSFTYIAEERTCLTGNTCRVTTIHCCLTSLLTLKTQPPLLLDHVYRAVAWKRVDQIRYNILMAQYKLWSSSLCTFLQPPVTSPLFGPNILPSTLFWNTLSLCSSINVRDQVSHPYRTTGIERGKIYKTL
jgi:hypothetical protein